MKKGTLVLAEVLEFAVAVEDKENTKYTDTR
jgi:hypothetical protein